MPRDWEEDLDDGGLPPDVEDRMTALLKGSPVLAKKPVTMSRPYGKPYHIAAAFDLTPLEREAEKGLTTGRGVSWRRHGDYDGKKPVKKVDPKFLTEASMKLDENTREKWEGVLAYLTFKTTRDGELICVACDEGQYDCQCDPNPWVLRAMRSDPLVKEFGLSRNGHPHFSGSGAPGFLHCDAYVLVNAALPDVTSEYAAYGTICHKIASDYLEQVARRIRRPEYFDDDPDWIGYAQTFEGQSETSDGFTFETDAVMLAAVKTYVDVCLRDVAPGDEILVEKKVDYSRYLPIPKQGGTLDFALLRRGHCLIRDAKFGEGVKVFAKGNEQLLTYAGGVIEEYDWLYDFQEFDFIISQPRMDHEDHWTSTRDEVLSHMEKVRAAGIRSWKRDASRTPGPKQCRWCADKLCPAKSKLIGDMMAGGFDTEDGYTVETLAEHKKEMDDIAAGKTFPALPTLPIELSTAALALRKKMRPVVDGYFAAIEEELLLRARKGQNIPFFDHVEGRASNAWLEEEEAAQTLKDMGIPEDKVYTRKIISVKTARDELRGLGFKPKLIKELLFDGREDEPPIAQRLPGKTVLAPIEEGRVKYADEIASGFDADDDDDGL